LLITILGDYVRPGRRPVPTSAFIDALGRLEVEEMACRQALIRAAADGWLVPIREGRYTWWQLSPAFEQFLNYGAERIFGFGKSPREWDGRWLVVLARVPEGNRAGRYLLRTRMRWAGFGSTAPGVWITTNPELRKNAEFVLEEAGVEDTAQIFLAERLVTGDAAVLVHQAWDLDEVDREYRAFIAAFTRAPSTDPLVRLTRLVHAWRRLPLMIDPGLPTELLPSDWVGERAAKLFHRQHTRWFGPALAEWQRISSASMSPSR
jgi:phenylacetic acid degradation operon negative regulatory protein